MCNNISIEKKPFPQDPMVELTVTLDSQLKITRNTMKNQSLQPKSDISRSAWNNA